MGDDEYCVDPVGEVLTGTAKLCVDAEERLRLRWIAVDQSASGRRICYLYQSDHLLRPVSASFASLFSSTAAIRRSFVISCN